MRGMLLQTEAAEQFRGRIFGEFTTTMSRLLRCGVLLAGALGDQLGVRRFSLSRGACMSSPFFIARKWPGAMNSSRGPVTGRVTQS